MTITTEKQHWQPNRHHQQHQQNQVDTIIEDLDWYISQAGDDIHLIEKFEAEDSYDLYEALELDELAAPGAPPVVKGHKKLDVRT